MHISIGSHRYVVEVVESLVDEAGHELLAQADYHGRRIRLSARAPLPRRLALLGHEVSHVFDWEVGAPESDEARADRAGHVTSAIARALEAQGGVRSLLLMSSGQCAPPPQMAEGISGDGRRLCGVCMAPVTAPSIVDDQVRTQDAPPTMRRRLYCEHCGHVQTWREPITAAGTPTGEILGPVTMQRGREVDRFLKRYGQLYGCACVA